MAALRDIDTTKYPEAEWFAVNLGRLRKARGLSQSQVAALMGSNPNYVSALERARVNPSLVVLSRIAKSLDVPLWTLLQKPAD